MSKRYTITAALPYANGPVHIGHLAGVYVPADIYARFRRSTGEDVIFVCGTDEHGVPITIRAKQEGVTPQDVVDKYHGIIKDSFAGLGISFDIFSRTSNETHKETASEYFKNLYEKGVFKEITSEQFYDEEAKQFLADRYIKGTCPKCGNEEAYGDQCEKCGSTLSADELINPKSALSGNQPIKKETTHWYLPLDEQEDFLKKWILEDHKEWKSNVYGQCKSWLDAGLKPRAVTRDLDWGVPVPVEGADGKVLYVWFDAPIGYISATKELAAQKGFDWGKYWKDDEAELVHFIGKDNIVFHCIIFPAMLKADGSYNLPENVPANEFLNLEGNKLSTSKNWAVWLNEYLEDFPDQQDVLRYALCANAPETKDNDFTWKDFQTRNNSELVAILGNFINRAVVLTHKYFDGKVPAMSTTGPEDDVLINAIKEVPNKVSASIQKYKFRDAVAEMMELARAGNKYLADTEPWKLIKEDEERVKTIMNLALQTAANLSVVMEPFIPFSSQKLADMLKIEQFTWDKSGNEALLEVGHEIEKASLLFAKIEDKTIEAQMQRLEQIKIDNEKANATAAPIKEEISFDDFQKMDLRIGKILDAEKVAKTKKLLKMTVDLGFEKRTIVSGIAEHYTPEDMIGKQVTVLVNLAPRKIKGIESQGMILMAEDADGKLQTVEPDNEVNNGSSIA
ncbi:methionine--tRNA ligase [Cyclobacteriaceae bacterium]|nr:methionine--tRNA ligase [Cyclobacteriaceae bacterium]